MAKESESKPAERTAAAQPATAALSELEQEGLAQQVTTGKIFALPRSLQPRQIRALQRVAGNRYVQRSLAATVIQRQGGGGDTTPIPTLPDLESKRAMALHVLKKAYGGLIKQDTKVTGIKGKDALYTQYDYAMIRQKKIFVKNNEEHAWKVDDAKIHPNLEEDFAGFHDPSSKMIYIDTDRKPDEQVATIGHELLHANASGAIIAALGRRVDEGMTEDLMKKAFAKSGFSAPGDFFAEEITFAGRLYAGFGENTMMAGYFGSLGAVRSLVDTAFDQEGKFDYFARAVRNEDWSYVNKFFDLFQEIRKGSEVDKKRAAILSLMGGWWFSDEDLAHIERIWSGCSDDEKMQLRPSIEQEMSSLSDHGDRASLRIIISS